MTRHRTICLLAILLWGTCSAAHAVNSRVYPLAQVIQSSDWIARGPAKSVDATHNRMVVDGTPLKGTPPAGQTEITTDGPAGKQLLERVAPGRLLVLFASNTRGGVLYGFADGTWFQAQKAGGTWKLITLHPEMARTWTGASATLANLVNDVIAGKAKSPPPDPKVKPSLGPVLRK